MRMLMHMVVDTDAPIIKPRLRRWWMAGGVALALFFLFVFVVLLFETRAIHADTTGNYVCERGETRILNHYDCCPSVKNYICENYTECGSIDPDCINTTAPNLKCAGSKNEYNLSMRFGYNHSKNLCYPGHCDAGSGADGGKCVIDCSLNSDCTSGFCVEGECVTNVTRSANPLALDLTSLEAVVFEGEDIQVPYTIINNAGGADIYIDSIKFDGILGRFFKPEMKHVNVTRNTRETVLVDVDSFGLSQMFMSYLKPGHYQVRATFSGLYTGGGARMSATDFLDIIVLPTFIMQNTKNLPPQRTIGHTLRRMMVNDTDTGRLFPVEVEAWVW